MSQLSRFAAVIIIALIFGSSCSKKDDATATTTGPTTPAVCQVTKISTVYSWKYSSLNLQTTTTQSLEYDSENRLSKITTETSSPSVDVATLKVTIQNSTVLTTYIYKNGVIVTVTAGTSAANWTVQNGKLVKVTQFGSPFVLDISYDAAGSLVKHQSTYSDGVNTYTAVYDASRNLTSDAFVVASTNQHFTESRTYSAYDTKKNPYNMIAQSMGLSCYLGGYNPGPYLPEALGQNNPGTALYVHTEPPYNQSYTLAWSYTYDGGGRVRTSTQVIQNSLDPSTTVTTFTYSNCD